MHLKIAPTMSNDEVGLGASWLAAGAAMAMIAVFTLRAILLALDARL